MKTDTAHLEPRFHISQRAGYLNDPNGPVEVGSTTHLFFQSRSTTDLEEPVAWGHATSDDLVDWAVHPAALVPSQGGLDSDGCWSGNTLLTREGIRAYYSGHDDARALERLLTALSLDGGTTFGRPELLLPDPAAHEDVRMLRDPFVWETEQGLRMVAGSIVGDRAAVRLYRQTGDSAWRYERELASAVRSSSGGFDTGEGWECPQIVRLDDREVAIVGSWSFTGGTSQVFTFPLDDSSSFDLFDHGDAFYAASAMRKSSHGPVVFGWVRETRDADWWDRLGWAGAISAPRRCWLEGASTRSEPVPALERLRLGAAIRGDDIVVGAQAELVLDHLSRTTRIDFGPDQWLELDVDLDAGTLTIARRDGADDDADRSVIRIPDAFDAGADRPAVRMLVDGSVVEAFTSAGRSATTRVYPTTAPPWRVRSDRDVLVWRLRGAVSESSPSARARSLATAPRREPQQVASPLAQP